MNFPPDYVENYVKNWLEEAKKKQSAPAEVAMISDILTLVGIAKDRMKPAKPLTKS